MTVWHGWMSDRPPREGWGNGRAVCGEGSGGERRESRMGFSVWVDWRVLGGVLADVMSWVVCVW